MNWTKKVKVSELKENPKNPRQLTEKGLKDLENSIKKFGVAEPLVCNSDLMICGGHGRKKILERLNIQEVDCYLPEKKLTQEQFDELGIRLNKNIAGVFDFDILANEFEVEELLEWGFEEKELDLDLWNDTDESKLDEVPEIPKTALSKLGDIFLIDGRHRVMCGDSTKGDDVGKLMDGKKADMVFTDIPYGIDYSGGRSQTVAKKDYGKIKGDSEKDISRFLKSVIDNDYKRDAYVCVSPVNLKSVFEVIDKYEGLIVWKKNNAGLGYQFIRRYCEFILFITNRNKTKQESSEFDFWDINKDNAQDYLHGTQKPVALSQRAITFSSVVNDLICDWYCGSGSKLIACEQTKRICYGMEIDPIYIDVILKRYKKLYPNAKFECLNRKYDFEKLFESEV